MNKLESNNVLVAGQIASEFEFNHEVFGEKFYMFHLQIERKSGIYDIIPVMVSERMLDVSANWIGELIKIQGEYRSHNIHSEESRKMLLYVFAQEIVQLEDVCYINKIELDGYICKETSYRTTPLGREITDMLVAVNRDYGKSDYIPCISWGRNAKYAGDFEVGTHIKISGRIQSREYNKRISDTESEKRVAYEVSIYKLEVVDDEE